jgi:hypothetical protein
VIAVVALAVGALAQEAPPPAPVAPCGPCQSALAEHEEPATAPGRSERNTTVDAESRDGKERESEMRLGAWAIGMGLAVVVAFAPPVVRSQNAPVGDNPELSRMFREDQADREPGLHGIDWAVVKPRDDARLARTRELYAAGALHTGADWWHAAMVLQHSSEADDYLLAHEMSVAAVALGEENAKWLAAAAEDRFLMRIGRKQRFGTQYEPSGEPGKFRLADTDAKVTDALRAVLDVPSLAEARATASRFDEK